MGELSTQGIKGSTLSETDRSTEAIASFKRVLYSQIYQAREKDEKWRRKETKIGEVGVRWNMTLMLRIAEHEVS